MIGFLDLIKETSKATYECEYENVNRKVHVINYSRIDLR
jgi:hypothetical protein